MKLFLMDSIARSTNIILTEKIAYNNHFKAIPEINSSNLKSLVIIGYHVLASSFKNILSC